MTLQVVVFIKLKPGCRDPFLAIFNANVPAVRSEPGCIEYAAHVDAEGYGLPIAAIGPETVVITEKWESKAALRDHSRAPHIVTYQAATKDLIDSRTVHVLSSVTPQIGFAEAPAA